MDIFQRAANIFDRAQGRVADATNQAARLVLSAAQLRALEARHAELRQQLEAATMELGKLAFQHWKAPDMATERTTAALCAHIDRLHAEYQRVVGELMDARAAPLSPASYPPASAPPPYPPPYSPTIAATPLGPLMLPTGAVSPGYQPPLSTGQPVYQHAPIAAPSAAGSPFQPAFGDPFAQVPQLVSPTPHLLPAAARPSRPARECPECYSLVPGTADFCPSCGMRV